MRKRGWGHATVTAAQFVFKLGMMNLFCDVPAFWCLKVCNLFISLTVIDPEVCAFSLARLNLLIKVFSFFFFFLLSATGSEQINTSYSEMENIITDWFYDYSEDIE